MKKKIILRADGNSEIGLGHVIRLIALAEILGDDQFRFDFYSNTVSHPVENEITRVSDSFVNIHHDEELFLNKLVPGEVVVIDGYSFDEAYQRKIRSERCKLVCIDDLHDKFYDADVVINHAGGVKQEMYRAAQHTKFYLGMKYCLLRKEFVRASELPREVSSIEKVFVCFGGASSSIQIAANALENLLRLNCFREIDFLLGDSSQRDVLQRTVAGSSIVKLHESLNAGQVCDLISSCDLAIVPASNISLEAYATGIFMITGLTADNQKDIYSGYHGLDYVFPVGDFRKLENNALERGLEHFNKLPKPFKIKRSATDVDLIKGIFNDIYV